MADTHAPAPPAAAPAHAPAPAGGGHGDGKKKGGDWKMILWSIIVGGLIVIVFLIVFRVELEMIFNAATQTVVTFGNGSQNLGTAGIRANVQFSVLMQAVLGWVIKGILIVLMWAVSSLVIFGIIFGTKKALAEMKKANAPATA